MLKNKKGFTLIELLIVVTVLGILAAVILPRFTSQTTKSKQNSHMTERTTINTQCELLAADLGIDTSLVDNLDVTTPLAAGSTTAGGFSSVSTAASYWSTYFPDKTAPAAEGDWKCNQNGAWKVTDAHVDMSSVPNGDHITAADNHES